MACGDVVKSGTNRLSGAFRRIAKLSDQELAQLEIARQFQPVFVIGDLGYAFGRPGWRGVLADITSPAVAARKSAIGILADQNPITVQWALSDTDAYFAMRSCAAIRTAFANDAAVAGVIDQSGDDRQGQSATSQVVLLTGDIDPAALPTPSFYLAPAAWPSPTLSIEIPLGQGLLIHGEDDNTALLVQFEVTEHRASG